MSLGPLLLPIAKALCAYEDLITMITVLAEALNCPPPTLGAGYYAAGASRVLIRPTGVRPIWGYPVALLVGLFVVAIIRGSRSGSSRLL
jgi:hypothetical protein